MLLVAEDLAYAQFLCDAMTADPVRPLAVTHVTSLSLALSRLETDAFDLLLLDLVLPDGSGLDWLIEQRSRQELPPVLVLANAGDEALALRAVQSGAHDYLLKSSSQPRLVGRLIDYTIERERTRQHLKRTADWFRSLLDDTLEGVAPSGPEQANTDRRWEYLHPDDVDRLSLVVRELVAPGRSQEALTRHADGLWHALDTIAQALLDTSTREVLVKGKRVADPSPSETTLRESEEQLRQAQKMEAVGRLAGGVAHDFSNFLTIILGASEHLLERLSADDSLRKEAEAIRGSAERAAALTQQLLSFSRQRATAPTVLSLNDVLLGTEQFLRPLIGEHIELRTFCAPDLGTVRADQTQLEQVLLNLAINARDAMPTGGRLTIETINVEVSDSPAAHLPVPGRYILTTVTDTGVGMDTDTQARAFDPFFTTKAPGKGTGLGLSTVYGIVKQSGGFVSLHSAPGTGTRVMVYLPRIDAPATVASKTVATKAATGNETLLLVEDEDGVRELVREMLERAGYRVIEAADPLVAENLCNELTEPIHLLLTDVVMPGIDGQELARRVVHARPGIKVLLMSGYPEHTVASGGVLSPGTHFLAKPFERKALLQRVRQVLDAKA